MLIPFLRFFIVSSLALMPDARAKGSHSLAPKEIFERTQVVLDHFQVPPEPDSAPYLRDLRETQTADEARKLLPILDPSSSFKRFFKSGSVYQDRDAREVLDYSIEFASDAQHVKSAASLRKNLQTFARNDPTLPLQGLRIALDPGHMGGKNWDQFTGKYIKDHHGNYLNEGVMALQVSLLLEAELQKLGAHVLITHRSLGPVAQMSYQQMPLLRWSREELRYASLNHWFLNLLESAAEGPALFEAFEDDHNFEKLFSEESRAVFFLGDEDLEARVRVIEKFAPHVTLIIHFDTDDTKADRTGLNPRAVSQVKAYVAGAYAKEDFATREGRRNFARHLLDPEAWEASLLLSRSVVKNMSKELGIPAESPQPASNIVVIEPGVIARNLWLTQSLSSHAVSYVETLRYNAASEFYALLKTHHPFKIDGADYPYSDRLAQIVSALRGAVVDFVASYR